MFEETTEQKEERLSAWMDPRNVRDHLKGKSNEEIQSILKETANPFAVCVENWLGDFNIGTVFRNANAFNAKDIYFLGKRQWDRRGAQGVQHYSSIKRLHTTEDLIALKDKYTIVGVDNVPGSVSMETYEWKPNTLMVFGSEGFGLTPETQAVCESIVEIKLYGSVRSFNAGVASGIAMYDFVRKVIK